jgi:hypothetical protein
VALTARATLHFQSYLGGLDMLWVLVNRHSPIRLVVVCRFTSVAISGWYDR